MRSAVERSVRVALAALAGMVLSTAALATPLNLAAGDEVLFMAFDAFYQTEPPPGSPPNGGTYDRSTQGLDVDGRISSVTVDPGTVTKGLVAPTDFGVTFTLTGSLSSWAAIPLTNTTAFLQSNFVGSGAIHWSVNQAGLGTILNGTLFTPLTISGVLDLGSGNITVNQLLSGANLAIVGGDPDLVAALGGGAAILELDSAIFNFVPGLPVIGADLNLFNDNFTFAASGTITPKTNAPFVPEPATALLFAGGLLGLLAAGRRMRGARR
jgi:hypothetical protein